MAQTDRNRGPDNVAKPNILPSGVAGRTRARASAASEEKTSAGCARLPAGKRRLRMMKITRIWVAIDSMNHAVRNVAGSALKTRYSRKKVRRSNAELRAPIRKVKR